MMNYKEENKFGNKNKNNPKSLKKLLKNDNSLKIFRYGSLGMEGKDGISFYGISKYGIKSYSNSGKLGSNTLMQASQMMSASNIPAISPYSFNQSSYQMSPSSYVVPQSTYNMPDQPSIPNYQSLPSGFPPPSYRVNPY